MNRIVLPRWQDAFHRTDRRNPVIQPEPAAPAGQKVGSKEASTRARSQRSGGNRSESILLLFGLGAWLYLQVFLICPPDPGIDFSHVAAATHLVAHGARYGREVLFTYGPLSPLVLTTFEESLYGRFLVLGLCYRSLIAVLLCSLAWRHPGRWRWIFLVTATLLGALDEQVLAFLCLVAMAGLLAGRSRAERFSAPLWMGLAAILSLVKFTFLVEAACAVGCAGWIWLRRGEWKHTVWLATGSGLALVVAWLGAGQQLIDLPGYVGGGLEITAGYSRAMALDPGWALLWLGLAMLVAGMAQVVWAAARSPRRDPTVLPLATVLVVGLFLAWKQGYGRADDSHVYSFFHYVVLGVALTPLVLPAAGARTAAVLLAVTLTAGGIADRQCGFDLPGTLWGQLRNRWRQNAWHLSHLPEVARHLRAAQQADRARFQLPRVQDTVGNDTVDVFGFEQAIAVTNQLAYTPPPAFQGYFAFSSYLAQANERFYHSPRAPRYVLAKFQTIDYRMPALDDARVLVALLHGYEPRLAERGYLLLQRESSAATGPGLVPAGYRRVAEGTVAAGGELVIPALPSDACALWCELDLPESILGNLLTTLYHQPLVFVEVSYEQANLAPHRWRLVPSMARDGFLISPEVGNASAFCWLQTGRPGLPTPRKLRITDDSAGQPGFGSRFIFPWRYRIYAVPPPSPSLRAAAESFVSTNQLPIGYEACAFIPLASRPEPPDAVPTALTPDLSRADQQPFLLVHSRGTIRYPVPAGARVVDGEFGVDPQAWRGGQAEGTDFRIAYQAPDGGEPVLLFQRDLCPLNRPDDRGVQRFTVDLPANGRGLGGTLLLEAASPLAGDGGSGWLEWREVRFW